MGVGGDPVERCPIRSAGDRPVSGAQRPRKGLTQTEEGSSSHQESRRGPEAEPGVKFPSEVGADTAGTAGACAQTGRTDVSSGGYVSAFDTQGKRIYPEERTQAVRKAMLGYVCFRGLILMALTGASMLVLLSAGIARANDIKVCKASESPLVTGTFAFTLDSTITFSLPVGSCFSRSGVGEGDHTVTETLKAGFVVSEITVDPPGEFVSDDLAAGTVTAHVSGGLTTITFVNTPAFEGICHNIGGPRGLGANCDAPSGSTPPATCTVQLEEGPLVVLENQFLGIIVPFNQLSGGALDAHIKHGDGPIVQIFPTPLHLASTGQIHKASNVECLGERVNPQPPEPGN